MYNAVKKYVRNKRCGARSACGKVVGYVIYHLRSSTSGAFPAPVTGAKKHREQDTGIGPTLRAVAAALLVVVVVLLLLLLVVVVLLLLPPWAMCFEQTFWILSAHLL